jgi:hypothetical protein
MLAKLLFRSALTSAIAAAGASAWSCEDDHPPVIAAPTEKFILRDTGGRNVLRVAFDPRGVGAVVPSGDDASRWIDADDSNDAWHYREWQWWKGHPWGESCRPRYYSEVEFSAAEHAARGAVIAYQIDGFNCRQTFHVPDVVPTDAPYWDLVTTIRNTSGRDVEEYGQFFACYTRLNRGRSFWYWDESGDLVLFSDRGVGHLDGYIAHPGAFFLQHSAIPHCPRGGGKIVGRWRKPLILSHASPAGWRSVIMIEPQFAASLAQGIQGGAMDYILFPGPDKRTFADGAEFSAHIRHVMLKSPEVPGTQQLQRLWDDFQRSHKAIHERSSRL